MAEDVKPKSGAKESTGDAANRARNRTVMLTPDITGQVRARLQQDITTTEASGDQGFVTPNVVGRNSPSAIVPPSSTTSPVLEHTTVQPQVGAPTTPSRVQKSSANKSPIVGFLVSFDVDKSGEYHELRTGRLIITSEEVGAGNHLVINDPTISPMHAILRVSPSGELQVLDQLSEHGTWIRRFGTSQEEQLSGDKSALEHGDMVRFGERKFIICLVCKPEED